MNLHASQACVTVSLLALVACGAPTTQANRSSILPLRTLRLYETGVGYFERSGELSPGVRTELPVPAGHLDDALKTLVVLSANGKANVHGLEFGSSVSKGMARALAGLPMEADKPITYRDLLLSLKGAEVEVRTSKPEGTTGRLVDVVGEEIDDSPPKPEPGKPKHMPLTVVLLSARSEIVRFVASDITSVRPTDATYATRLGAALDALQTRSAKSERMIHLFGGGGPVRLGYVAETPIWRTTYRLVLAEDGKSAILQAWALVHNDTDEDWRSVKIDLVNGKPDSFLFPLAAPRYARRALVHPENELSTVPQLLGHTVDALWGDHLDEGAEGIGMTGIGEGGGGYGHGVGLGSIGSVSHGSMRGATVSSSSLLSVGNLASVNQATGVEAGALFTYSLGSALDLRAHGSALVPFLGVPVDAEPIAWFEAAGSPARSAVRFVNTTRQTLPVGTMSFFGAGGFAGESAIERLKPGERRFLHFGVDLDTEAEQVTTKARDETKRLTFREGNLQEHFLRTTETTYRFENRSGSPRAAYLVLPIHENATVTGADRTDFDSESSRPVAVFRIDPRKKTERAITTVEGLSRSSASTVLTFEQLTKIAASTSLSANEKAIAGEAATKQRDLEETRRKRAQIVAEVAEIDKDLTRLREHLKALGGERAAPGNQATANPFVQRILAAEDRLAALRKTSDALETEDKTRLEAVRATLVRLDAVTTK